MQKPKTNKWVKRVVALQHKMPHHLAYNEHADYEKHARDWVDESRDRDRLQLMRRLLPISLEKAHILEVGSGVGAFVVAGTRQGLRIDGVEPIGELVELNKEWLQEERLTANVGVGAGEQLPYPDKSFDVVVSFQVLEHVNDPQKVIYEALRVLRPGGYIFFNIPNYHSFWEGHYGIFWWPSLHKYPRLMSTYIKLLRRDPAYTTMLNFITPQFLRNVVAHSPVKASIENLGYDIWRERLRKSMPAWGYTKRLLRIVAFVRSLGLIAIVDKLGQHFEFYTPIIFICRRGD